MQKRLRFYTQNCVFDSGLSVHAIVVYCYLSFRANRKGICFPSRETIAGQCNVAVRTVDKALAELQAAGLVKSSPQHRSTTKGKIRRISNLYQLVEKQPSDVQDVHTLSVEGAPTSMQEIQAVGAGGAEEIDIESNLKESHKERISSNHCEAAIDERLDSIYYYAELERLKDFRLSETIKTVIYQMYHQSHITVNGAMIPQHMVREQLERLDFECIKELTNKLRTAGEITRGSAYLMACIYNAPNDLDIAITAEI